MNNPPLIGVLGGMGPLAAVEFTRMLVDLHPVTREQQHAPVLLWNVPQIPDRQQALAGLGESPLPAMLQGIAVLNAAGATRIVIACNTAHHWVDALAAHSAAPILHIVDATLERMSPAEHIGLLATRGALRSRLYQQRLEDACIGYVTNTEEELDTLFMPGCYAVKHGRVEAGGLLLQHAAQALVKRGATHLLLACTEIVVGLECIRSPLLPIATDSSRALAQSCLRYWRETHTQAGDA